jgi:hypothetical protein
MCFWLWGVRIAIFTFLSFFKIFVISMIRFLITRNCTGSTQCGTLASPSGVSR